MSSASSAPPDDAVPLDALFRPRRPGAGRPLARPKHVLALFVIFIFVVSDVFTNSVTSGFRGAVEGRAPTAYGVAVQGVFLVIFYVLVLHLIEAGVI